jgi:hypothetical protein
VNVKEEVVVEETDADALRDMVVELDPQVW